MSLGQAQTGQQRSIPKAANMKAADNRKVVFKNMGNNHAYPMMWADTVTMSGTSLVLASGIAFHGMELASNGNITCVANGTAPTAPLYIDKDTALNIVYIKSASSYVGDVDVQVMFGGNAPAGFIAEYACRANTGATKNF